MGTPDTTMRDLLDGLEEFAVNLDANGCRHRATAVREAARRLGERRPRDGVAAVGMLEWHPADRVPAQTHRRVLCAVRDDEKGDRVVPGFYDAENGVFRPAGDATQVIAGVVGWAFMPSFPEGLHATAGGPAAA